MANFRVVVSDAKTGNAHQIEVSGTSANAFIGKTIGRGRWKCGWARGICLESHRWIRQERISDASHTSGTETKKTPGNRRAWISSSRKRHQKEADDPRK